MNAVSQSASPTWLREDFYNFNLINCWVRYEFREKELKGKTNPLSSPKKYINHPRLWNISDKKKNLWEQTWLTALWMLPDS